MTVVLIVKIELNKNIKSLLQMLYLHFPIKSSKQCYIWNENTKMLTGVRQCPTPAKLAKKTRFLLPIIFRLLKEDIEK